MISDISGTTNNSFSIGRLDGFRLIFAKNAAQISTLTFTFPTNYGALGQVLVTDGAGGLSWSSAIGYGTVLPGGSNISGAYDGDLLVKGNAVMNGDVEVKGDLIISNAGSLTYSAGTSFIVHGDVLVANNIDLRNLAGNNPSVNVGGSLHTPNPIEFRNYGVQTSFTVKGSIYAPGFRAEGMNAGSKGQLLTVYGDFKSSNLVGSILIYGNEADGGDVDIKGLCENLGITAGGGISLVGNAFDGGDIELGSYIGDYLDSQGGNSVAAGDGDGGDGGNITVHGPCDVINGITTTGGEESNNGSSGSAGNILIKGDLKVKYVDAFSQQVTGGTSGHGGNLTVYGCLIINSTIAGNHRIWLYSSSNSAATGSNTGNGGSLIVHGDLIGGALTEINCSSGNSRTSVGNGGSVSIYGKLSAPLANIKTYSGNSASSIGANAGSILIDNSCVCKSLDSHSGNGTNAGNAGAITINGNATVEIMKTYGGRTIANGGGADGKNIFIKNDLTLLYTGGGSVVDMRGGSSVNSIIASFGGNLTVQGNLKGRSSYIDVSAGNYLNGANSGANSGNIIVYGNTSIELTNIIAKGGNGIGGADGGDGGTITLLGSVNANIINASAGSGANTGDAGTITIAGGGKIKEIINVDSAPRVSNSYIYLGGTCVIEVLNFTNRANNQVRAYKTEGCILQIGSFTAKNVLYGSGGSVTVTLPELKIIWYDVVNNTWLFGSNVEGAVQMYEKTFDFNDIGSILGLFTLPANARMYSTSIITRTNFNGISPTAKVGVNGGVNDKYMEVTENDLKNTGVYEARHADAKNVLSENLELTVAGGGVPTQGVADVSILYSLPKL